MTAPKTALVLAAGLGTRMRPLTNDRPKALVEVGGRALIDHVLDRLADAGVETAVVNVHAFADRLEGHLADRRTPHVVISDERACLLLARLDHSIGFEGAGDFFIAEDGRLTFRGEADSAPYAYMGLHITKPQIVDAEGDGAFSLAPLWRQLAEQGRLYGAVMDGFGMHVGDPVARDAAEARLR